MSLSTPIPLAIIPYRMSIIEAMTMTASKELKKSRKYLPLDAKVLRQISMKKMRRNAKSMLDKNSSEIMTISARVNQNNMKAVYRKIKTEETVSTTVDSNPFKQNTLRRGIIVSVLAACWVGAM